MEANKVLPESMRLGFTEKAHKYALKHGSEPFHLVKHHFISGAVEYAQKLHLLQQEYDRLKTAYGVLECSHADYKEETERRREENDKLKGENEKLAAQHADLCLALAAMLNGYQNLPMYQRGSFTVPRDLINEYTRMALKYDSTTSQR